MIACWVSHLASHASYLQLYWMLQTGRAASLAVYRLVTNSPADVQQTDPDRKRGWFEFRRHTKLHNSMAFIWSLYVLWAAVNAYFYDGPPSDRFQDMFNFVTPPRQITVGVWGTCFAVTLYVIHSIQRLYEGLRVSIFSDHRSVGLLTFLSDMAFPVAAGLSLVAHSPDFQQQPDKDLVLAAQWYYVPALLAFTFASKIQKDTFQQLQKLRRNRFGHIVTTSHKLPSGGWFDRLNVASPHYFAEIVIHVSVGVVLGMRCSTWWLMTGYLVLNHLQLATDRCRFYREKFDDFPKDRKILIPYIL